MSVQILVGDALSVLRTLPSGSVHCCVTSPPYFGLRSYDGCSCAGEGRTEIAQDERGDRHTAGGAIAFHRPGKPDPDCTKCGGTGRDSAISVAQLGQEATPDLFIAHLVEVFREVWRVLRPDATLWLNIGDSYAGSGKGPTGHNGIGGLGHQEQRQGFSAGYVMANGDLSRGGRKSKTDAPPGCKAKDLLLIPFRLALALQADGWWVRSDIAWCKKSCMPESVQGSSWRRHQVTSSEYRELFRLRKAEGKQLFVADSEVVYEVLGSGAGVPTDTGVLGSQGEIPEQSEGPGYREGSRATARREGEAATIQPLAAGSGEQGEVRGNTEGPGHPSQDERALQTVGSRQGATAPVGRSAQVSAGLAGAEGRGGHPLASDTEGSSGAGSDGRTSASSQEGNARRSANNGRVARDSQSTSLPLLLLQDEASSADDGSRDTAEQGWGASEGERGPGLFPLQLEEERQVDDALVDCPGCAKCAENDGYILRMSAGRPTSAWEHVFLLSKQPKYFYDSAAVREEGVEPDGRTRGPKMYVDGGYHRNGIGSETLGTTTGGANQRNFWLLGPEPYSEAHFATYPTEIPRRAILAGTSERGVCPTCGAPWVRVVSERSTGPKFAPLAIESSGALLDGPGTHRNMGGRYQKWLDENPTQTTGWRPSCKHDGEPVPATVLDPFAGAFTTSLVAERLGRNSIGIELNPTYAAMGEARLRRECPMFTSVAVSA